MSIRENFLSSCHYITIGIDFGINLKWNSCVCKNPFLESHHLSLVKECALELHELLHLWTHSHQSYEQFFLNTLCEIHWLICVWEYWKPKQYQNPIFNTCTRSPNHSTTTKACIANKEIYNFWFCFLPGSICLLDSNFTFGRVYLNKTVSVW